MSKIDISPGWVTRNLPKLFECPSAVSAGDATPIGANSGLLAAKNSLPASREDLNACVLIMKGAVPVNFTSIATINARKNDILIAYLTGKDQVGDFVTSDFTSNPVKIATDYKAAIATGVATWFWWISGSKSTNTFEPNTGIDLNNPLLQNIYGTVGANGSGADLILDTGTNIVQGQSYRLSSFSLNIPTRFGY